MSCVQEGLCAIIGTIRRGFDDLYEAKQTLVYGNTEDDGNYADEVHSRRSFYFGPSSGQGISGKGLHRRGSIPKTSYGSRRASSNSLISMGRGNDRKDRGGAVGLSGSHSGGYQALRGPLKTPATPPSGGIGELFLASSFLLPFYLLCLMLFTLQSISYYARHKKHSCFFICCVWSLSCFMLPTALSWNLLYSTRIVLQCTALYVM